MKNKKLSTILLSDFYKQFHREQYPKGITKLYSTLTPRGSRMVGIDKVVCFGIQGFIEKYLIEHFNENFFNRELEDVIEDYIMIMQECIGRDKIDYSHIEALHKLGYLPLEIKCFEEGELVPVKCPMLTIENTVDEFYWLVNFIETLMLNCLWQPISSATIGLEFKKILTKYANETCCDNFVNDGVPFQAHDFSMRSLSSLETCEVTGGSFLLSFKGTDSIPSIHYMNKYYDMPLNCGKSIASTEHSVMCSYGQENEDETYRRLIEDVYPSGDVAIVSDTWNIWRVITETFVQLKDKIEAREGKISIRPDSGLPIKILLGDNEADTEEARKGVVNLMWEIFGGTINEKGYKVLNPKVGIVYGDGITIDRCEEICKELKRQGYASSNVSIGCGGFSLGYLSRDTFGFALKSTYAVINGEEKFLFKNPITDSGKKSQKGMVFVSNEYGKIKYSDELNEERLYIKEVFTPKENNMLKPVFKDGKIVRKTTYQEIYDKLDVIAKDE